MPEATKSVEKKTEAKKADGTLTVVLRDTADSTVDSVTKLVIAQGGSVGKVSGAKVAVTPPVESERNPDAQRQRIVAHLLADPLVVSVD